MRHRRSPPVDEPGGMAGLRLGEPPSSVGVQKQTSEQKDARGGVKEEANGLTGVREPPGRCHPCPTGFVECRAGGRSSTGPASRRPRGCVRPKEGAERPNCLRKYRLVTRTTGQVTGTTRQVSWFWLHNRLSSYENVRLVT